MNILSKTSNLLPTKSRAAVFLLAALLLMFFTGLAVENPVWAASKADEACKSWYEDQAPEEQVREDNEAQISNDVDGDGCTGILAAPDSGGPVEGALKEGGVPNKEQSGDGDSGPGLGADELAQGDSETPAGDGGGGSGDGGFEDCAEKFANDSDKEQMREREEDQQFNVDNDGDGCIAEQSAEDSTGMDGTPADAPEGESVPETSGDSGDDGGLNGMVMGFFKDIMTGIWDWTFGWALDSMGWSSPLRFTRGYWRSARSRAGTAATSGKNAVSRTRRSARRALGP